MPYILGTVIPLALIAIAWIVLRKVKQGQKDQEIPQSQIHLVGLVGVVSQGSRLSYNSPGFVEVKDKNGKRAKIPACTAEKKEIVEENENVVLIDREAKCFRCVRVRTQTKKS